MCGTVFALFGLPVEASDRCTNLVYERNQVMLKRKPYAQEHKATAEKELAAYLETLKSEGMTEAQILRNATVKHIKGKIRQSMHQLTAIEALENQIARKAEVKAEKQAAPKINPPKKKHAPDPLKKKVKKEKPVAAPEDDE
jgi:hypothetical protein